MKWTQTLLLVALAGLSGGAFAQWQWIDKDGHKVFSDRAPPVEIPDKNILKRPPGRGPATTAPTEPATEGDSSAPQAAVPPQAGKPSALDKELEAKKKKAAEAETAKRKAAAADFVKAQAENCKRAKQSKATMESGTRLVRTNAAGEREIMDEAAVAEEIKRTQLVIDRDCK